MSLGTRKLRIVGLSLVIVCGATGAVWGAKYWSHRRSEQAALTKVMQGDAKDMREGLLALSKEDLSGPGAAAARRKAFENMRRLPFEDMAKMRDSDDLTEEQRKKLRDNAGELMRGFMDDRVNEYYSAPKEEKERILDQHLDEFLKFREQMEAEREKRKNDPDQKAREDRWKQQGPRRDTQEAKARMEGGNPDQQAKMMHYFSQMQSRAKARGVEMGGGHGGGWWGGRRGGAGASSPARGSGSGK